MRKAFYNAWIISTVMISMALMGFYLTLYLDQETHALEQNSMRSLHLIEEIKRIPSPQAYLPLLKEASISSLEAQLKTQAKEHHITLKSLRKNPDHTMTLTLQGELDTDVMTYLQEILSLYSGNLSIQDMGLFRQGNLVLGKVTLPYFTPFNRETP